MGKHKEWRKIAKKERRKKIRKLKARERCVQEKADELRKQSDSGYKEWLLEQERLESFKMAEAERIHDEENEKWMRTELLAQQQWRKLQEKIAKVRLERAQQDLLITKEWEEQQQKIKDAQNARKQLEEEQIRCHNELMMRIEQFASGIGELPKELLVIKETNAEQQICPFYSKIGICRFGDSCSRNHRKPSVSRVLLVKNFYSHFGIEHSNANEYDTDILLEYDEKETYSHFKSFFDDVFPEFSQIGKVIQFKVCCNFERHLRGNTYVEYATLQEAVRAYKVFHGRWYGGKQISVQFCDVPSWKQAICGLFASKRCPKGKSCNFLHVFRNPNNMFLDYEKKNLDFNHSSRNNGRSTKSWSRDCENSKGWRWSESPEPASYNDNKPKNHRNNENYDRNDRKNKKSKRKKHSKSRSRSKERYHSTKKSKKRHKN